MILMRFDNKNNMPNDEEDEEMEEIEGEDEDDTIDDPNMLVDRDTSEASPDISKPMVNIPISPEPYPRDIVVDKRVGLENIPSVYDEEEEKNEKTSEYQKKVDAALKERERQAKFFEQKLKEEAGDANVVNSNNNEEEEEGEGPTTPSENLSNLSPEELEDAIRYYIEEEKPTTVRHLKKIANQLGVDYRKVMSVAHELSQEKRQIAHKQLDNETSERFNRIERETPAVFQQPIVPGIGSVNPQDQNNMTAAFIQYILANQTKAEDRAYQTQKALEDRNNQMMLQMMELMKQKNQSIFEGEFGHQIMSRMMSSFLNPIPSQNDSAIGTAVKTMVETGQLGNIINGVVELGQAAMTRGKSYDLDIPGDNTMNPQPNNVMTTPPPPQNTQPNTPAQIPPERYVMEIKKRDPKIAEDVANVVANWVCNAPDMAAASPQEKYKYIVTILAWTEQLKNSAIGLHRYLIKEGKTPKEAADYVRKVMPDAAERLKDYDYDSAMRELERFRQCESLKKYIEFFHHPKVAPLVKAFFAELKNPSASAAPAAITDIPSFD